jgi:hypothetical protein
MARDAYGDDGRHPPLPYTASDLQLEDHPATREPGYYSSYPARLSSAGSGHSGGPESGRGHRGGDSSRSAEGRRARARALQQARARNAHDGGTGGNGAAGADREEKDLCCALLGPWRPFWGASSLSDMATSRVLPLPAFVAWRLLLAAVALGALAVTSVVDAYSLRGTQLIALLFAAFICLRLVFVSMRYRSIVRDDADDFSVHEPTVARAHIALMYQGNLCLQLFSPLGLLATLLVEPDRTDINNRLYNGEIVIMAPIAALAACSVVDVLISSVDFRLTYVLPTVLYGMLFMVLSIIRFGRERRGLYLGLSAAALLVIAVATLLFGRATNIVLRRKSRMQQRASQIHAFEAEPRAEQPPVLDEGNLTDDAF